MKIGPDPAKHWFVVRTGPNKERKASSELRKAGFDCYLPMQRIERYNRRNHVYRTLDLPLMPRYIFVGLARHGGELDFGKVTQCDGVDHFIPAPPYMPLRIPRQEVEAIFLAEIDMQFDLTRAAKKYHGEKLDRAFPRGAQVRVALEHLLSGYLGEVLGTNGKDQVFVEMRLGRVVFKPSEIMVSAPAAPSSNAHFSRLGVSR